MSYLPKLNPSVGGGLGGLPERRIMDSKGSEVGPFDDLYIEDMVYLTDSPFYLYKDSSHVSIYTRSNGYFAGFTEDGTGLLVVEQSTSSTNGDDAYLYVYELAEPFEIPSVIGNTNRRLLVSEGSATSYSGQIYDRNATFEIFVLRDYGFGVFRLYRRNGTSYSDTSYSQIDNNPNTGASTLITKILASDDTKFEYVNATTNESIFYESNYSYNLLEESSNTLLATSPFIQSVPIEGSTRMAIYDKWMVDLYFRDSIYNKFYVRLYSREIVDGIPKYTKTREMAFKNYPDVVNYNFTLIFLEEGFINICFSSRTATSRLRLPAPEITDVTI